MIYLDGVGSFEVIAEPWGAPPEQVMPR